MLNWLLRQVKTPIAPWKYEGVPRRNMYHNQRYMVDATRDILSYLSGGNMIGYISSILSESGHLSLHKIKPIITGINEYLSNKDNQ